MPGTKHGAVSMELVMFCFFNGSYTDVKIINDICIYVKLNFKIFNKIIGSRVL